LHHGGAKLSKPSVPGFGWVNKRGKGELFMEKSDSKSVKRLAKILIGVIVSLEVFACGFAAIVLHFSKERFENMFGLICYLAFLPLIGFIVFIIFLQVAKIIGSSSKKA